MQLQAKFKLIHVNFMTDDYVISNKCNDVFHQYCSYSTISANHLHMPSVKIDSSKTDIKYQGVIVWNTIVQT